MARDTSADARPSSQCTLDLEGSTETSDPLAHRLQTQMTGEGAGWIKPQAIVAYVQDQLRLTLAQSQLYRIGARMLDRILQGLLRDAVKLLLDFEGHSRLLAEGSRYRHAVSGLYRCRLLGQRGYQPLL